MPASEGITCHRACWLRQLIISSLAFRFAVQRASQQCRHPAPCVAICPHLAFPVPNTSQPAASSGWHPADQQVLPSSTGSSSEASEIPLAQTEENNQQLKSSQHPNSSLACASHSRSWMLAWQPCCGTLCRPSFVGCTELTGPSSAAAKSREKKKYLLQPEMGEIPGESSQKSKQFWNSAAKPALKVLYTFIKIDGWPSPRLPGADEKQTQATDRV